MPEMNTSNSPSQPFSPGGPGPTPGGCGRPIWIGCSLVILLAGIGAMIALWNAPNLFEWAMEKFEVEIMDSLPADVSTDQKERLSQAFAATREAVADGSADALALQSLQQKLTERIMSSGDELTEADVEEMIAALEAVAGGENEARPVEEPGLGAVEEEAPDEETVAPRGAVELDDGPSAAEGPGS